MNPPSHRAGRQAIQAPSPIVPPPVHVHHAPHAALLIDFDNVTLGIRSDLTKELRTLLNTDIIKGKVAVQRAYADWRRYPQYIVPLSESSIDLIFAPAFGTNKKNATDIRLAVDAIELVFTRPEIGTFILLSGDSDFSSLVIKLKEYGKYVIGVGIRESASDLLIQNCDEYFSYSDLAGLTKEADLPSAQRDPWELVVEAVEQMSRNGDVMRSDRLKQVMQQIDPNFDERNAGFNRFSKFVAEAGTRGLLKVSKLDNGQFEVAQAQPGSVPAARSIEPAGREGSRGPVSGRETAPRGAGAPVREGAPEREEGRGRRGRGRGRGRGRTGEEAPRERPPEAAAVPASRSGHLTLAAAFQLLSRALSELPAPVGAEALRARMAALFGREDQLLEPGRFVRFLRQANDAETADVRTLPDGSLEVSPHRTDLGFVRAVAAPPPPDSEPPVPAAAGNGAPAAPIVGAEPPMRLATLRFRRGSRAPMRSQDIPLVGVVRVEEDAPVAAEVPPAEPPPARAPARRRGRAPSTKSPPPNAAALVPAGKGEGEPAAKKRTRSRPKTGG